MATTKKVIRDEFYPKEVPTHRVIGVSLISGANKNYLENRIELTQIVDFDSNQVLQAVLAANSERQIQTGVDQEGNAIFTNQTFQEEIDKWFVDNPETNVNSILGKEF